MLSNILDLTLDGLLTDLLVLLPSDVELELEIGVVTELGELDQTSAVTVVLGAY